MKIRVHFSAFLYLALCLLPACASQRQVTLPDGSKLEPGPGYVSAKEMAKRGKNPYGVPETSFAFYPEQYEPRKKNEAGRTLEEQIAYDKALAAAKGGGVISSKLHPANAPSWDRSYFDPPSVRHNCFVVERLFVVPWGSGEGEVGMATSGSKLYFPSLGYERDGKILIWDRPREQALVYDLSGRYLGRRPAPTVPGLGWDIYSNPVSDARLQESTFLELEDMGEQVTLLPNSDLYVGFTKGRLVLADLKAQRVLCRTYLPPMVEADAPGMGEFSPHAFLAVLYPEATLIYPRLTREGLEILRYRPTR